METFASENRGSKNSANEPIGWAHPYAIKGYHIPFEQPFIDTNQDISTKEKTSEKAENQNGTFDGDVFGGGNDRSGYMEEFGLHPPNRFPPEERGLGLHEYDLSTNGGSGPTNSALIHHQSDALASFPGGFLATTSQGANGSLGFVPFSGNGSSIEEVNTFTAAYLSTPKLAFSIHYGIITSVESVRAERPSQQVQSRYLNISPSPGPPPSYLEAGRDLVDGMSDKQREKICSYNSPYALTPTSMASDIGNFCQEFELNTPLPAHPRALIASGPPLMGDTSSLGHRLTSTPVILTKNLSSRTQPGDDSVIQRKLGNPHFRTPFRTQSHERAFFSPSVAESPSLSQSGGWTPVNASPALVSQHLVLTPPTPAPRTRDTLYYNGFPVPLLRSMDSIPGSRVRRPFAGLDGNGTCSYST